MSMPPARGTVDGLAWSALGRGPLLSRRRFDHDSSQAPADMSAIPQIPTSTCRTRPAEISVSTKYPVNARATPRQKISSELCPHRIIGRSQGDVQARPSRGHEVHGNDRQGHEVREPEDVQIGLVDRIHPLLKPMRHQVRELREVPGQSHAKRGEQIGERNPQRDRGRQDSRHPSGAAERAPGAEHEQQLPGKGVERPEAVRISR